MPYLKNCGHSGINHNATSSYTSITENRAYARINTPDSMRIIDINPIYYKINNQC